MDPQEIFRECKNFVEKSDYENLAIQIKNLDDDDHIKYLCLQLNDKLDEKCNLINKEADSLNRLDENALYRFKDSIEEIKRVKLILNNYIDESMASKINETIDQKDVLELFSKKKADQELLSLVGTEILSEINELKANNSTVIKDKLLAENSDIKIQSNKQNSIFNSEQETTENKLTSMLISFQNGLQAFTAKKLEAFNPEIEKLRKATDLLNAAIITWNSAASIENMSDKVPKSLIDQIIREHGEITKINNMITDLPKMLQINTEILQECQKLLEEEELSDTKNRNKMKEKWTRTASRHLTECLNSEIKQQEELIKNAANANKIIENKYTKNLGYINLLSKSANEIATATYFAALQNNQELIEFRRLMNEVEAVKNVRKVLEYKMNSNDEDALNIKLIRASQVSNSVDEVINNELKELIEPMRKQVCENIQEQEKLLDLIEKAYFKFKAKITDEMIKNLESACDICNDLHHHLEEAFNFYNDLMPILLRFKAKVDDFVLARKIEEDDLIQNL